ncbi:hypothetical protein llap_8902 [Limosa lapponica baueri]|uniref:Uncharacterized protein n=1 Tax=Limosa lapponica baueri TaxID=1758121 RepID=A0A2I0U459_LIMLA|nr:hypothetical protein llap_8902 [Limosa lapponica baueri]
MTLFQVTRLGFADIWFSWAKSSCKGWVWMLTSLWKKKEGKEEKKKRKNKINKKEREKRNKKALFIK